MSAEKIDYRSMTLHEAAAAGEWSVVWRRLRSNAFVDKLDAYDRTPLHLAAQGGHEQIVSLLLQNGADADAADGDLETPLMLAAHGGHVAICIMLLDAGAGANSRDMFGRTALHVAAASDHGQTCFGLMVRGADPEERSQYDETPLMEAARRGHANACRFLLIGKASINARDRDGNSAFDKAVDSGSVDACKAFIDHGASLKKPWGKPESQCSALHRAAMLGHLDLGRFLVKKKMSSALRPAVPIADYLTPFQAAVLHDKANMVRFFVEECGESLDQVALSGKTLIELAARSPESKAYLLALETKEAIEAGFDAAEGDRAARSQRSAAFNPL